MSKIHQAAASKRWPSPHPTALISWTRTTSYTKLHHTVPALGSCCCYTTQSFPDCAARKFTAPWRHRRYISTASSTRLNTPAGRAMAEVLGVISGLYTAGQALHTFALEIRQWRRLSERLFDIKEGLDFAKLSLDSWQQKYDIQVHRPDVHTRILFGKEGHERITATIGTVNVITGSIKSDIKRVRGLALNFESRRGYYGETQHLSNEDRVKECLWRIRHNTTWSRRFELSVLGKANDLEERLRRLYQKLTMLERFTDFYLEREHAEIFSEVKRLPGRRVIIKVGDGRTDTIQSRVLGRRSRPKRC